MTESDTELRAELRRVVRNHDPSPDTLRSLADDLDELADKWEQMEDTL